MKSKILFVLFNIVLLQNQACHGQNIPDSTKTFRVETKDGNIFVGSVISEDSTTLVIKAASYGEIKIPQSGIKSKTELKEVIKVENKIWLPNPQSGRYFWAPNGYGLEKGLSNYQTIWVIYNQVSYGLTNNFSLGAGILPGFLLGGLSTPIWLVPKFSIPVIKDKINI